MEIEKCGVCWSGDGARKKTELWPRLGGLLRRKLFLLTGLEHSGLLTENVAAAKARPDDSVLYQLTDLALSRDQLPFLAVDLFEILCKVSGQEAAGEYLGGIQYLAAGGTEAGARLLAAFLNVAAPGDRLSPLVAPLDSSRRYASQLLQGSVQSGPRQSDWQRRLMRSVSAASALGTTTAAGGQGGGERNPRQVEPWPLLRGTVGALLAGVGDEAFWQDPDRPDLLAEFFRLEIDAWQERISALAGSINPFRIESVARILPLLNRADSEIRDLRQMAAWIAERNYESAFLVPQPRWREVLDDKDWGHLLRDLGSRPELWGLRSLAEGLETRPVLLPHLAEGVQRTVDLSRALMEQGVRDTPLDLLTACLLVQSHYRNGQIAFALEKDLAEAVSAVLPGCEDPDHPLRGISMLAGLLIIDLNPAWEGLPHGLPVLQEPTEAEQVALKAWRAMNRKVDPTDLAALREQGLALIRQQEGGEPDDEELEVEDLGASALKHLVMQNLQSVSVLLGFLRNPKIISIPGLVEEVANRTRNPQIIATIASERALHSGFANKGVPVACLRSPVNVSVKTLRKFCHVKYVSKVELKRMANDRTGIRKEVAREIARYLEALA